MGRRGDFGGAGSWVGGQDGWEGGGLSHLEGLVLAFLGNVSVHAGKGLLQTLAASLSGEQYLGGGHNLPPQHWVVSPC